MAGWPAWLAAAVLHGLALVVPSALVSLSTGFGEMLLGYLWVVGLGGAAPLGVRVLGFGLVVAGLGPLRGTGPWVHSGPYAFVRHPSEIGLALATLGVAWMAGSVPALLVWPVLVGLPGGARGWMEDRAVGRMGLS